MDTAQLSQICQPLMQTCPGWKKLKSVKFCLRLTAPTGIRAKLLSCWEFLPQPSIAACVNIKSRSEWSERNDLSKFLCRKYAQDM